MTHIESRKSWQEQARRVEATGFSVLLAPDHFALPLAPVPALLAAADATTALRVGSYVFANDFRHPTVLAKEAATLDVLTEGRFELGIGAGWNSAEYRRAGIPFASGRVRYERLCEATQIISALLNGGPVTFAGTHYATDGVICPVETVQRPMPLLVGGGSRNLLIFAAQHASIVGLMGPARNGTIDMSEADEEGVRKRVALIREAAGERFEQLELNLLVNHVELTNDRDGAAERIAAEASIAPAIVINSPHYMIGTHEQLREQVLRLRSEHGVSYFSFFDRSLPHVARLVTELASA